jgi:hypothetical protein
MATAAIRSKQLSDMLAGDAPHMRECQCEESEPFLGYFGGRIEYVEGASESGFKHVEAPNPTPELIRFMGKDKKITTKKVALSNASLNKDDVYVLDKVQGVYMWIGGEASRLKIAKALDLAARMKMEHGCPIPVQVLGTLRFFFSLFSYWYSLLRADDGDDNEEFWGVLGGLIKVTKVSEDSAEENEVWLYR